MPAIGPFDLVLFGGSGDLAMRKLLPALYYRDKAEQLPEGCRIIGVGRRNTSPEEYLDKVDQSCRTHVAAADFSADVMQRFARRLDYLKLDATVGGDYEQLAERLNDAPAASDRTRVFFLSTASNLFAGICANVAAVGLVTPHSRVVLEKPVGHDLASARRINEQVGEVFEEHQIYRIDHYLGKETVQNLMALRFGNALFEPLWRRDWIRDVQITLAEQIGAEGRGEFYDQTGALRDMVQNHMLQLLSIVAMEPPTSIDPDCVRDEKLKVLRALRPMGEHDVTAKTVRGQYRAGASFGQPAPGYLEEPGVPADSRTETFVALKAEIDTWRWAGVPFYLRTGKRLQERVAEIVVNFRKVPHSIFGASAPTMDPNRLVIRLQPDEGVKLVVLAKSPGDEMRLRPVNLDLDFAETFKTRQLDAYERLLMDIVRGKLTLFMRRDELDAAWSWVEPILDAWDAQADRPKSYTAGTWGPAASIALIGRDGCSWHEDSG